MIEGLKTDLEYADALVGILIDRAIGGVVMEDDYSQLRSYFVNDDRFAGLLPEWFASKRSVNQFWQFIKDKYGSYSERRAFLWGDFERLLAFCERGNGICAEPDISSGLDALNNEGVSRSWARALDRIAGDPEGAITAGRTLVEVVCKRILEQRRVQYKKNIKLNQLYRQTVEELNLAPEQNDEDLFRQVLGGCSAVVNGLGSLRNTYGDAHAPSEFYVRPHVRHARLAVNLAGAMSLFFVETANN